MVALERKLITILILLWAGCSIKQESASLIDGNEQLKEKAYSVYHERDYLRCVQYFTELITLDTLQGDYYFRRAFCHGRSDNYNKSTQDYLKAVALGYRISDSYYNIGLNYTIEFNDSLALEYFIKALQANPNDQSIIDEIEYCRLRLNR
jgi:tetratricopeptide (TPR) repeat protein